MNWAKLVIPVAVLLLLGWLWVWCVYTIRRGVRRESSSPTTDKEWQELTTRWKLLFSIEMVSIAALYGFLGWKFSASLQAPASFFPVVSAVMYSLITGFLFVPLRLKLYLTSKLAGNVENWARMLGLILLGFVAVALATGIIGVILAIARIVFGRT